MSRPFVPPAPTYLLPREACALLRVSENTLRKLWRQGKIAAYPISERRIVFRRDELEAFVASQGKAA